MFFILNRILWIYLIENVKCSHTYEIIKKPEKKIYYENKHEQITIKQGLHEQWTNNYIIMSAKRSQSSTIRDMIQKKRLKFNNNRQFLYKFTESLDRQHQRHFVTT